MLLLYERDEQAERELVEQLHRVNRVDDLIYLLERYFYVVSGLVRTVFGQAILQRDLPRILSIFARRWKIRPTRQALTAFLTLAYLVEPQLDIAAETHDRV